MLGRNHVAGEQMLSKHNVVPEQMLGRNKREGKSGKEGLSGNLRCQKRMSAKQKTPEG